MNWTFRDAGPPVILSESMAMAWFNLALFRAYNLTIGLESRL
jgi:hypothetical protein